MRPTSLLRKKATIRNWAASPSGRGGAQSREAESKVKEKDKEKLILNEWRGLEVCAVCVKRDCGPGLTGEIRQRNCRFRDDAGHEGDW
jgi:hypothetical protein